MNSQLIKGLLLASSVCLLFGIGLTVADVMPYKNVPAAPPVARPARPQPAPAAPVQTPAPEPAAQAPMLRLAPEGTWGVLHVDGARMAASPLAQSLQGPAAGAQDPSDVPSATIFMLPVEGPLDPNTRPEACGVMELKGQVLEQFKAQLAEGEQAQVAGVTAYKLQAPPQLGMPMRTGPAFAALVDESTALFGTSEAALGAMMQAHQAGKGAPNQALARAAAPFAGSAVTFAFYREDGLAALLPPGQAAQMPTFLTGARGGALSIDLQDTVAIKGMLVLGDAAAAQEAAAKAEAKLSEARQQMQAQADANPQAAQMMQPVMAMLDTIQVSAEGNEVHAALSATAEQVQALQGAVMGMIGGMMPGGPGGGPPAGMSPRPSR